MNKARMMFSMGEKMTVFKGRVKSMLGRFIFGTHLQASFLRDSIPILAFHRVARGSKDDSLTYPPEDFEKYCRFLSKHFDVVSLSRVLKMLNGGKSFRRELAITFDDGYRVNLEFAIPVLETLKFPATFFISPSFVGGKHVPWWDREAGVRYEWMTWTEVRELNSKGFEIGSHTMTHADMGSVSEEQALRELVTSRNELEQRLSAPVTLFAFPYGGRDHMTEKNRELVKVAGYSCCCSCFGGLNMKGADPFHLRRIPISNWYQTPYDFGFQLTMKRV